MALFIRCKEIIAKEMATAKTESKDAAFVEALCWDACTVLLHNCAYILIESGNTDQDSAIQRAVYEVGNDVNSMLDDLQLVDLCPGAFLDYVHKCGKSFNDDSFLMEFVTSEHYDAVDGFIDRSVNRIFKELLLPILGLDEREVVDVRESPEHQHCYIIVVKAR